MKTLFAAHGKLSLWSLNNKKEPSFKRETLHFHEQALGWLFKNHHWKGFFIEGGGWLIGVPSS